MTALGSPWEAGVVFFPPQAHRASSMHRASRQASHFFAVNRFIIVLLF
jgi:hypothetical protein